MNRGRSRSGRLRLVVIITLFSILALGSFWIYEIMRRSMGDSQPSQPRAEPDYYVEKFMFVRMSKTGLTRYDITGAKLTHYPMNDSYEIQQPILNSYSNPQSPMKMHAERALIDHTNNKIHMVQDVQLDRPASAAAQHFHLDTEYLLMLPDDDVMQTDKEVTLTLGPSRLSGAGMLINNATREFHLLHEVRGIFPAAAQSARR